MKKTINNFKLGDIVTAEVIELLGRDEVIVNFDGDLLRLENHSTTPLAVGCQVKLRVSAIKPLVFRVSENQKTRRFDIHI